MLSSATWLAVAAYQVPSWRAMIGTASTDWIILIGYGIIWAVIAARGSVQVHDNLFIGLYFVTVSAAPAATSADVSHACLHAHRFQALCCGH